MLFHSLIPEFDGLRLGLCRIDNGLVLINLRLWLGRSPAKYGAGVILK